MTPNPPLLWLGYLAALLAFAKLLWWLSARKTVKAVLIVAVLVPALAVHALWTAWKLFANAVRWTFKEYLRKLNAKDHLDAGL